MFGSNSIISEVFKAYKSKINKRASDTEICDKFVAFFNTEYQLNKFLKYNNSDKLHVLRVKDHYFLFKAN